MLWRCIKRLKKKARSWWWLRLIPESLRFSVVKHFVLRIFFTWNARDFLNAPDISSVQRMTLVFTARTEWGTNSPKSKRRSGKEQWTETKPITRPLTASYPLVLFPRGADPQDWPRPARKQWNSSHRRDPALIMTLAATKRLSGRM